MSLKRTVDWKSECVKERLQRGDGKKFCDMNQSSDMDSSRNKSWVELMEEEEEEEYEEENQSFQNTSQIVNESTTGNDKINVCATETQRNHNVSEFEGDLQIKEEMDDQSDDEARIQSEMNLLEQELIFGVKQEKMDDDDSHTRQKMGDVTNIKVEKNDENGEVEIGKNAGAQVGSEDCNQVERNNIDGGLVENRTDKSIRAVNDFSNNVNKIKKEVKVEPCYVSASVEQKEDKLIKTENVKSERKRMSASVEHKEDKLIKTENVKSEGKRKRSHEWNSDKIPEKLPHREKNQSEKKKPKKVEYEYDSGVLSRRQKQIDYGKNTLGYDRYRQQVPKEMRTKKHPKTPPKNLKYSRRAWDGMVRVWRQRLHFWDPPSDKKSELNDSLSDISLDIRSQTSEETSSSDSEEDGRVKRNTESSTCSFDTNEDYLSLDI